MNSEMAYLLGLICGNGEVIRQADDTIFSIEIPHRKIVTETKQDVKIFVKASISDMRNILEPLIGTSISFVQNKGVTYIRFTKKNEDYLVREIVQFIGKAANHRNMRVSSKVFNFTTDEKVMFLRGFSDVTGYIRRSNYFYQKHKHRVYLEIPHNWNLVVDICNLLKSIDVPVQSIDWAHPNMRDPKRKKYDEGKPDFWKKEHQIKIWANEFSKIGFEVIHKMEALELFVEELNKGFTLGGKSSETVTHRFYWECRNIPKLKPNHPGEYDNFLPKEIRGKHYNGWKEIAHDLGYHE
ncbi:hypothetical protein SANA_03590 [Gottschalkiaceae bacterium SANA]|nr:hypothetical protein SANA_03590 [Gottschalkiaceae bacterium SANA]